jgi:hypothetical protein
MLKLALLEMTMLKAILTEFSLKSHRQVSRMRASEPITLMQTGKHYMGRALKSRLLQSVTHIMHYQKCTGSQGQEESI